jgi:hypothetical protein
VNPPRVPGVAAAFLDLIGATEFEPREALGLVHRQAAPLVLRDQTIEVFAQLRSRSSCARLSSRAHHVMACPAPRAG